MRGMRAALLGLVLAVPMGACLLASQAAQRYGSHWPSSGGGAQLSAELDEDAAWLAEVVEAESADVAEFAAAYECAGHQVQARAHAVEKHGEIVLVARTSFGGNNPNRKRRECPKTDRAINAALMENGDYAIMIEGLTSMLELTCWTVSAKDFDRIWQRLSDMHECEPEPETKAAGHDWWSNETH